MTMFHVFVIYIDARHQFQNNRISVTIRLTLLSTTQLNVKIGLHYLTIIWVFERVNAQQRYIETKYISFVSHFTCQYFSFFHLFLSLFNLFLLSASRFGDVRYILHDLFIIQIKSSWYAERSRVLGFLSVFYSRPKSNLREKEKVEDDANTGGNRILQHQTADTKFRYILVINWIKCNWLSVCDSS